MTVYHGVNDSRSPSGGSFVRAARKVYNPLGFKKGYNFPLFVICAGGLLGFCLSRVQYLNISYAKNHFIPGEMFWYSTGYRRIGIQLHLIGAVMGGMLAAFQFVPVIRYKVMILHRINGYAALLLYLVGMIGVWMILPTAVGAAIDTLTVGGVLGVTTMVEMILAYINIKRLQIDQHRAWMIRGWSLAASIVSQRLIQMAMKHVVQTYTIQRYYAIPCREIFHMYQFVGVPDEGNPTALLYAACATDPATSTVQVAVDCLGTGIENIAAVLRWSFGSAMWIAVTIHAVLPELYLWLTPAESYRLRTVSYQRQVEAGMRSSNWNGKDAGTTARTMGDAPEWWSVPMEQYVQKTYGVQGKAADSDGVSRSLESEDAQSTEYTPMYVAGQVRTSPRLN